MGENNAVEASISPIKEFYRDRNVFITGATGFMGKVLLEKLLRSCPDIGTIYILMRPKRGCDVQTRFQQEILNCELFSKLRREHPAIIEKVSPISGDITVPGLGLSEDDKNILIDNVSVVFHSAATVKFNDELKVSLNMNVQGTQRIVRLCKQIKNLAALIHVSTCYCNCDRDEVEEIVYPSPCKPNDITSTCEWMPDHVVNSSTPLLLDRRPNTYTFTKAVAETVLLEEGQGLPISIVRPSIVTGAWKEPLPGWVDNLNGPSGVSVANASGVMRTLLGEKDKIADLIPVDIPINTMIAAAWQTYTNPRGELLPVYNCSSGDTNKITWQEATKYIQEAFLKYPMNGIMWYPAKDILTSNTNYYRALTYATQYLPAYIIDFFTWATAGKPRLVRLVSKLDDAMEVMAFFSLNEWTFHSKNVQALHAKLSVQDQNVFGCSLEGMDWKQYTEDYWLGIRKFILKEDVSTIPAARKQLHRRFWLNIVSKVSILLLLLRILASRSKVFRMVCGQAITFLVSALRTVPQIMRA